MEFYDSKDTIIACSSGNLGNSAIAVIRISGNSYFGKINKFFGTDLTRIKPRYATFCSFFDNDKIIDEIVVTYFKGPNSYNGEDILEMSVHGNQLNVKRIIDLISNVQGIRHAEAGEFTYRAMKNNKVSLTQVEGLDLLLNAKTIFCLDQGYSLMSGKLQDSFKELYNTFLNHKSSLEFGFDFLEDMGEERFNLEFKQSFEKLNKIVSDLIAHVSNQSFNLIKPEISIFGLPNAGKSTLFNRLLKDDRAIVSNIAGTTRDFLREDLMIGNNLFTLIDTAGIRPSDDEIEGIGIKKGINVISKSFYKMLLVNPFEFNEEYYSQINDIEFDLILFSHQDKPGFPEHCSEAVSKLNIIFPNRIGPIEPIKNGPIEPIKNGPIEPVKHGPIEPVKNGPIKPIKNGPIEPVKNGPIEPVKNGPIEPIKNGPIEPIYTSLTDKSVDFEQLIYSKISSKYLELLVFDPVLVERHSATIRRIADVFLEYSSVVGTEQDLAIVGSELNIVGHCISELIGIVSPDDVLHNIFDNFCIGK